MQRFPEDFMFQLSKDEFQALRSHFGTLKRGEHSKYLPYAFTEHGAIMLASVLNTQTAVEASIYVVRAFVRLRKVMATHAELSRKLAEFEQKLQGHDAAIRELFSAIRQLLVPPEKPSRRIGFRHSHA